MRRFIVGWLWEGIFMKLTTPSKNNEAFHEYFRAERVPAKRQKAISRAFYRALVSRRHEIEIKIIRPIVPHENAASICLVAHSFGNN